MKQVQQGETSWETLEAAGLALPPKPRQARWRGWWRRPSDTGRKKK
jgi:hypothetical protein